METCGSQGERALQALYGTEKRALQFYNHQMLDHVNEEMRRFIARMEMVWVATADAKGACDASFRAGPPGFVEALDAKTLVYPEYRGNGVLASLGNIHENPHIGLVFIDFLETTVGLHVNGTARIVEARPAEARAPIDSQRRAERWVVVGVEEAYIHCSKHVPLMKKLEKTLHWGSDNHAHKGGDFFRAKFSKETPTEA